MTTQMTIRINPELKGKLSKIARMEGKATSEVIRELIETYIEERDIETYVNNLWDKIGKKLQSKGVKLEEVEKAITEVRRNR